jgi:hypothetical protein
VWRSRGSLRARRWTVNGTALVAIIVLAAAFLAIFGSLYLSAVRSQLRDELDATAVRILRWAVLGQLCIYVVLALTAFFSVPPAP